MPLAKELHITHIHHTWEDADTFFPKIDTSIWQRLNEEFHEVDEKHAYAFTFATYVRT
jgi:dihydrofolate reductase